MLKRSKRKRGRGRRKSGFRPFKSAKKLLGNVLMLKKSKRRR